MPCTSCAESNRPLTRSLSLFDQGDQLEIDVSKLASDLLVKNLIRGTPTPAKQDLSERRNADAEDRRTADGAGPLVRSQSAV